jgi:hypothetical protein
MSRNSLGSQTNAQTGWFLLFDENYEGPVSPEELRARLEAASIPQDTLLWQAGRTTWEPVSNFAEFRAYVDQLPVGAPKEKVAAVFAAPLSKKDLKRAVRATASRTGRSNEFAWYHFVKKEGYALGKENFQARTRVPAQTPSRQKTLALAGVVGTFLVATSTYFALRTPKPTVLAQLNPEEREELFLVVSSVGSPKAAIAIINHNSFTPSFVISTNLKPSMPVYLRIEDADEKSPVNYAMRARLEFKDGVATGPVFRDAKGASYPRGSYKASVWAQLESGPDQLLNEKIFWLN